MYTLNPKANIIQGIIKTILEIKQNHKKITQVNQKKARNEEEGDDEQMGQTKNQKQGIKDLNSIKSFVTLMQMDLNTPIKFTYCQNGGGEHDLTMCYLQGTQFKYKT